MKNWLCWLLAILITLTLSIYQRKTGPTRILPEGWVNYSVTPGVSVGTPWICPPSIVRTGFLSVHAHVIRTTAAKRRMRFIGGRDRSFLPGSR